jgi:hypothetical protein
MKDSILDSARKIKDEAGSRFNGLKDTIKGFYQKIQNPSQWAGSPSLARSSGTPNRRVGRAFASTVRHGAGGNDWGGKSTMSISSLKRMICPNGDCGTLFNGLDPNQEVDVATFLSMIGGNHGFGGWSFAKNHTDYIKNKSDKWSVKPPIIQLLGGIATKTGFKVGEFNNGKPNITWEQFKSMAGAIFSAIPYKFYYDSSWKGSWLGALQAGACNCYDGALALMAFANACGFGGSMVHGTWKNPDGTTYPHVWANINGVKMDTTAWQKRGRWSAGSPSYRSGSSSPANGKTVNINVEISGTVYNVEDLDSRIQESVKKGLREEFNDPYTVTI